LGLYRSLLKKGVSSNLSPDIIERKSLTELNGLLFKNFIFLLELLAEWKTNTEMPLRDDGFFVRMFVIFVLAFGILLALWRSECDTSALKKRTKSPDHPNILFFLTFYT
jgi:hypothetical protein